MKQKTLLVCFLALAVTLSGCGLFKKKKEEAPKPRAKISEPVNIVPVAERPYVTLVPSENGRNITLGIGAVNKPANEAEFELNYTTGDLVQGAFGSIDLAEGSGEYEILLGSCSTGGTCSYHENISGGDAVVSMRGSENYAVKIPWRYQKSSEAKGAFGTTDQKFQISGTGLFSKSAYVIVTETSGPPATVEGNIVAGPYGVFTSSAVTDKEAKVMIRANEDLSSPKLLGWDGEAWEELDATVDGKTVEFTGTIYEAYVVTQ